MRRKARTDANQLAIVHRLLLVPGLTLHDLSAVGRGCPDLLVGYRGHNYLLEVKTPVGKLTTVQRTWHHEWCGQVHVVTTPEQALDAIGANHDKETTHD